MSRPTISKTTQYHIIGYNYVPVAEGFGSTCEHCGRLISHLVDIQDGEGNRYTVGQDCAKTLSGIEKDALKRTDTGIKAIKKFTEWAKRATGYSIIVSEGKAAWYSVSTSHCGHPTKPILATAWAAGSIPAANVPAYLMERYGSTADKLLEQWPELANDASFIFCLVGR